LAATAEPLRQLMGLRALLPIGRKEKDIPSDEFCQLPQRTYFQ
jgi:hypothetical protein